MQQVDFSIEPIGCKAVLRSNVSPAILSQLKARNTIELELNVAKGWSGDLNFIANLTSLKKLVILQIGGGEIDLSPIQSLTELTDLYLSTYSKSKIDFKLFSKLVDCSLEWQPGFASIFEVQSLEKLLLNKQNS